MTYEETKFNPLTNKEVLGCLLYLVDILLYYCACAQYFPFYEEKKRDLYHANSLIEILFINLIAHVRERSRERETMCSSCCCILPLPDTN